MSKVKIKLAALGQLPFDFDQGELLKWKSTVFELSPSIESYQLNEDSEGDDWQYTDDQLEKYLAKPFDEDFLMILVNVRLQHNWYVRRLSGNRFLFSFHEIADILRSHNIPLRNIVLRVLYAATLVYRRYGDRVPEAMENTDYAHDETRGCLFDMNASKWDVVHSCHEPVLCEYCVAALKKVPISNELIGSVQKDIAKIRKPLFHRIVDFVKRHPIWSLVLSIISALVIGIISSMLAMYLYQVISSAT